MNTQVIRALFYDGQSSSAREVTLAWVHDSGGQRLSLRISGSGDNAHGFGIAEVVPAAEVQIAERVGNARRFVQLPDNRTLEVIENEAFDAAMAHAGLRTFEEPVRWLERRWSYALAALMLIAVGTWGFLRFGVPALANRAVSLIPPSIDARIGTDSLALLDRGVFKASSLSPERMTVLRAEFADLAAGAAVGSARYRLEFRQGGAIGANAFALPSGIVVLTDELERAALNDDELRGVLAHEVGHLVHRHAMRNLVQSSASALLMLGLLGDVNTASSLLAALPGTLVNAAYSRDFERDADDFAYRWMALHNIPAERLGALLIRLSEAKDGGGKDGGLGGLLANHPGLQERLRHTGQDHSVHKTN